jgi:predicted nucleotidyltransferase
MKENLINFIEQKSPGAIPLLIVIRGSHAYGTNIETSDTDYSGIFVQSEDDILGNKYLEQINDDKNDTVIYEVRRFLELVSKNNPTVLELLNTPEDCILYKDPAFDMILENKDKFITKICTNSFGGYAKMQIQKAKGQNKKQNWEKDKVTRKTPLDFCYLHKGEKSFNLSDFLESNNMDQKFGGLSKSPHGRDVYSFFYDFISDSYFNDKKSLLFRFLKLKTIYLNSEPIGFKGISFEDSNDIRLSSIPFNCPKSFFIGHVSYNKDGYTQHCNDYKSYQTWLNERNETRWVDVKSHGQKIDGKNMMHCKRLIQMAHEIAEGKGIIVRRENAKELISIRKGEIDLQTLIDSVELEILEIDKLFTNSKLPDSVDNNFIHELIVKIRKQLYNK